MKSALKGLPRRSRQTLRNIVVVVEDWADEETLRDETMGDLEEGL